MEDKADENAVMVDAMESGAETPPPPTRPRGFRALLDGAGGAAPVLLVFPVEGYSESADGMYRAEASAGRGEYEFPEYKDLMGALEGSDEFKAVARIGFCSGNQYVWYDRKPGGLPLPPELAVRQLLASSGPIPPGAQRQELFRAVQTEGNPQGSVRIGGVSCALRLVRAAKRIDPEFSAEDAVDLLEALGA